MPIIRLSNEEVKSLIESRDAKVTEMNMLKGKDWKDMWHEDLRNLTVVSYSLLFTFIISLICYKSSRYVIMEAVKNCCIGLSVYVYRVQAPVVLCLVN